jgi:hypothetical protein
MGTRLEAFLSEPQGTRPTQYEAFPKTSRLYPTECEPYVSMALCLTHESEDWKLSRQIGNLRTCPLRTLP